MFAGNELPWKLDSVLEDHLAFKNAILNNLGSCWEFVF